MVSTTTPASELPDRNRAVSQDCSPSDKDFTGRERQGKGAYADTDGPYEKNETGPAGNTALTGREGNLDNNPVAQAKSRDPSAPSAVNEHPHGAQEGEHKGFIQKVKDALH